ncbi:hypothetical protein ABZ119_17105 [Streptomyces sp. NPDC006288]|uniref:hypothetical protein n=1 Tax=Streptomyces sp. NPDC006288 TaxID=3156743 RepID=UPI0033BD02E7
MYDMYYRAMKQDKSGDLHGTSSSVPSNAPQPPGTALKGIYDTQRDKYYISTQSSDLLTYSKSKNRWQPSELTENSQRKLIAGLKRGKDVREVASKILNEQAGPSQPLAAAPVADYSPDDYFTSRPIASMSDLAEQMASAAVYQDPPGRISEESLDSGKSNSSVYSQGEVGSRGKFSIRSKSPAVVGPELPPGSPGGVRDLESGNYYAAGAGDGRPRRWDQVKGWTSKKVPDSIKTFMESNAAQRLWAGGPTAASTLASTVATYAGGTPGKLASTATSLTSLGQAGNSTFQEVSRGLGGGDVSYSTLGQNALQAMSAGTDLYKTWTDGTPASELAANISGTVAGGLAVYKASQPQDSTGVYGRDNNPQMETRRADSIPQGNFQWNEQYPPGPPSVQSSDGLSGVAPDEVRPSRTHQPPATSPAGNYAPDSRPHLDRRTTGHEPAPGITRRRTSVMPATYEGPAQGSDSAAKPRGRR